MKITLAIVTAALFAGAVLSPAFAQNAAQTLQVAPVTSAKSSELTKRRAARYQKFLERHPKLAEQLKEDPTRLYDEDYRKDHPKLAAFLAKHPNILKHLEAHKPADLYRARYRHFLDQHPELAKKLKQNPGLLYDQKFRDAHPKLSSFLSDHPKVWERLRNERAIAESRARYRRYLDKHPDVARQLKDNPGLFDDPDFIKQHPSLHQFFKQNPKVRNYLKRHPRAHQYLEAHPRVRRYVEKHAQGSPKDGKGTARRFVKQRPGVHEYLGHHPKARHYIRKHADSASDRDDIHGR